ncbi:MAG: ABC transporter ATP-binding protein [Acidimicrobiia bacterium]|nr:ABC transporter ATP-binding protein [Acidimicrobiia bacterium]
MSGLEATIAVERGELDLELDLFIGSDRTLALLGPNGAGKSTVVDVLAGLLPLETGRIVLDGTVLDDPTTGRFVAPHSRSVGVVFQGGLLFPHLTTIENVEFGLRSRGLSRRQARREATEVLGTIGMQEFADRSPSELSGGEAQRIALARSLVGAPTMLLLDEPLSALDATTRVEVQRNLAQHLAAFDGPRLLITHDPAEAFLLADEVVLIEGGRVTQRGDPADIRLRPKTKYAADLAGSNFLLGEAQHGTVQTAGLTVHIADRSLVGKVVVTIHPRAVSLHLERPEGSARNVWETMVTVIEDHGDRVRVQLGQPLGITAEVTPGALAALALTPGAAVWCSVKATEVVAQPR